MLEKKIYKIILVFAIAISFISILTNIVAKFPFEVQIKWILLISISFFSYFVVKRENYKKYSDNIKFVYFLFIIYLFIPFAWIDSGGSSNNTIGYIFILIITTTYLFKKYKRSFLIASIILMFDFLIYIEHFYPKLIKTYSESSQFTDRMIQIPIIILGAYFLIKRFDTAYNVEKNALISSQIELEKANEELNFYANYDKLTLAANRRMFDKNLEKVIKDKKNMDVYVLLIDFDNFKYINDNYGHVKGDEILYKFVEISNKYFTSPSIISRWGGDEFAIIFYGTLDDLIKKLKLLKYEFENLKDEINIKKTISVGIADIQKESEMVELLRRADNALYKSKTEGKNAININLYK
ncbi:GGDEF domain-containing protein [Helicovermis profundi]|uniref:GGDEF domain-containing protein n=1 Tax=Helicovermis profundi TaxID=3065157 RepID=A0AAU9EJT3_9FIRM|nr:hypothetical protein HLPR_05450 [Clostridia bacterium S502]